MEPLSICIYQHPDSDRFGFVIFKADEAYYPIGDELARDAGFSTRAMATAGAMLAIGKIDGEQKVI